MSYNSSNPNGQALMTGSTPVVIASNQSTITVSATTFAAYSATIVGLAVVNTPTDIFTLTGSATKTVKITKVYISGTKTTAGIADVIFLKRSTANSSGTSTSPTIVPYDSTSAVATAVCRAYTANPTTGTLVGNIFVDKTFLSLTTTAGDNLVVDYANNNIVLNGTSQVFAINLNSITQTGNSFDIGIEWIEV